MTVTVTLPTITAKSREQLFRDLEEKFRKRQGFALATMNLDHVVKLRSNEQFRKAYARHNIITADGRPIVWLRRMAGERVDLLTGSDLVVPIARLAASLDIPVGLLGSTGDALERAAKRLTSECEGLRVVAKLAPSGSFNPNGSEADACLAALEQLGVQLCFIALGAPKQEILAGRGRDRLPHVGFISVGAGLDFIAGTQRRAPAWVRRLSLEWMWRLLADWRRMWRRYLACALIMPSLVANALQERGETARASAPPD